MHTSSTSFRIPRFLRSAALLPAMLGLWHGATCAAADTPWKTLVQENGTPYIPLDSMRSFYKLSPFSTGAGSADVAVSHGGFPIVFTPGTTRANIGGYECQLVHPTLLAPNGDLLVSQVDAVKLFDPLLRPTYITPRREVRTIILDPGHGGSDDGATANGIREADVTLKIALALRDILVKKGYTVLLTRDHDCTVSDQRRVELVQGADAPIFISIHVNSGRSDLSGIETYCMAPAGPGEKARPGNTCDAANIALAFSLHTSLVAGTESADLACRRTRFSMLSAVDCPAAMVEVGFATHEGDAAKLATPEHRSKVAASLAEGVYTFAKAMAPGAEIPSTTAPVDTTTPPIIYQEDPPPPPDPDQRAGNSGKGKSSQKTSSSSKGKGNSGKNAKNNNGGKSSGGKNGKNNKRK